MKVNNMKNEKKSKEWHSSSSKVGMGDHYGSAIKQKVGRIRDSYSEVPMSNKMVGNPPKSFA